MKRSDWVIATVVPLFVGFCLVLVWQHQAGKRPPKAPAAPAQNRQGATEPPLVDVNVQPNPSLEPAAVVRIVIDALRRNDSPAPDTGIAVSFRFASPSNKTQTGPVERFGSMVKSGFQPMLMATAAEYGPVEMEGAVARQSVVLTYAGNRKIAYLFILSKQTDETVKDCWMTDAVFPLMPPPPAPAPEGAPAPDAPAQNDGAIEI